MVEETACSWVALAALCFWLFDRSVIKVGLEPRFEETCPLISLVWFESYKGVVIALKIAFAVCFVLSP